MAEYEKQNRECLQQTPSTNKPTVVAGNAGSCVNLTGKITTLFFDLDNTLIPTRSGDSKATTKKLVEILENQFAFTKDESVTTTQLFLKAFRRCPDNSQTSLDSWRTYLWREALPQRYKHLAEQIYPQWLSLRYRYLALAPEYIQMLRRFREAGFLLALITNGPSNAQWEKINKLNVSQYFDCVLVSSDLPWEKPSPHIFYAACNFLGVKPAQCLMIGDKLETDIKGGRLANLGCTMWLPLANAVTDLSDVSHPPDFILANLMDMYKYFPGLGANATGSTTSTAASMAALTNAMGASTSTSSAVVAKIPLSNRRGSQFSGSNFATTTTTSTCESDQCSHNNLVPLQQQHQERQLKSPHKQDHHYGNKYRRGGSLPAMEFLNSETENSSDSLFG